MKLTYKANKDKCMTTYDGVFVNMISLTSDEVGWEVGVNTAHIILTTIDRVRDSILAS